MSAERPVHAVVWDAAVAAARAAGRPIVALESSVLAQGLPVPANREAERRMCDAVVAGGAVPAVTAVVKGVPTLGLAGQDRERFLARDGVAKVSARDLPVAMAQGRDGATTVAAALTLAAAGGIEVFATGGIGGVHRGAPFDESADLVELVLRERRLTVANERTLERNGECGVDPVHGSSRASRRGFCTREFEERGDHTSESARPQRAPDTRVNVNTTPPFFITDRSLHSRLGLILRTVIAHQPVAR